MRPLDITKISNSKVLLSEENEEFEGIVGSVFSILWEDSLEQLLDANNINHDGDVSQGFIEMEQNGNKVKFEVRLTCEYTDDYNEVFDFDTVIK